MMLSLRGAGNFTTNGGMVLVRADSIEVITGYETGSRIVTSSGESVYVKEPPPKLASMMGVTE